LDRGGKPIRRFLTSFVLIVFLLAGVNRASWNKTTRGAVIGGARGAVLGPEGPQKNRQLDIAVIINDKLKKAAQEKAKS
jgi:hypothetical protein